MMSEHAWKTVKTIDRSTVKGEYPMMSEHAWETVETIDWSTVQWENYDARACLEKNCNY